MSRRVDRWQSLEHRAVGCRGSWVVEVGQPSRYDDFVSPVAVRVYCSACDTLHQLTPFTQATDDPDPDEPTVSKRNTPLLGLSSLIASQSVPELHTLKVGQLLLRGHALYNDEPYDWDVFANDVRVGVVASYSTRRNAVRWTWGIGERYSVTSSQDGYNTARAAALGLAAALTNQSAS